MDPLLLLIIVVAVAIVSCRPKAPPEPIVIYIDRTPEATEGMGGCLPLIIAAFVVGVLFRLLAP